MSANRPQNSVPCETCEGKGYLEYGGMAMEDDLVEKEPCFDCGGTGVVEVDSGTSAVANTEPPRELAQHPTKGTSDTTAEEIWQIVKHDSLASSRIGSPSSKTLAAITDRLAEQQRAELVDLRKSFKDRQNYTGYMVKQVIDNRLELPNE